MDLLCLWVNLPVVNTGHPQSDKFATSLKIKAIGELELNGSPPKLQGSSFHHARSFAAFSICIHKVN